MQGINGNGGDGGKYGVLGYFNKKYGISGKAG